jgi:pyruvate dehydrogenase E2 component (dihydrolipoamide acetyltransferase)
MAGVRAIIAERMSASAHTTAAVTLFTEVDATALVQLRESFKQSPLPGGVVPGYNEILVLIVARALQEHPNMNARLVENRIEQLEVINIGVAVDTERGLLVPVIRDAASKRLGDIVTEFRELVERARAGRSLPDDLSGGTFTITNLGMYDVDGFTPIINLPECAILGVGRIVEKPAAVNGQVVIRPMMVLSLTFDHRINDGAPAARFLQRVKQLIERPYLLLA